MTSSGSGSVPSSAGGAPKPVPVPRTTTIRLSPTRKHVPSFISWPRGTVGVAISVGPVTLPADALQVLSFGGDHHHVAQLVIQHVDAAVVAGRMANVHLFLPWLAGQPVTSATPSVTAPIPDPTAIIHPARAGRFARCPGAHTPRRQSRRRRASPCSGSGSGSRWRRRCRSPERCP